MNNQYQLEHLLDANQSSLRYVTGLDWASYACVLDRVKVPEKISSIRLQMFQILLNVKHIVKMQHNILKMQ